MLVIIGMTTADLLVLSQESFANPGGDGFTAGNVAITFARACKVCRHPFQRVT